MRVTGLLTMRVVFIEDVEGVALGGEIKEVKNGFARNYLIPKNLAAPATHNNLQRIHKLTKDAAISRTYRLDEMKNLASLLKSFALSSFTEEDSCCEDCFCDFVDETFG